MKRETIQLVCKCFTHLNTLSSHSSKGITGLASSSGTASGIHVGANSIGGLLGARNVGLARIVGDESILLDKFVG